MNPSIGAALSEFDSSVLYGSPEDPQIQRDIENLRTESEQFYRSYNTDLVDLNAMLRAYESIVERIRKLNFYSDLLRTACSELPDALAAAAKIDYSLTRVQDDYLSFVDKTFEGAASTDIEPTYRAYVSHQQRAGQLIFGLPAECRAEVDNVESALNALAIKTSAGPSYSLAQVFSLMNSHKSLDFRCMLMEAANQTLGKLIAPQLVTGLNRVLPLFKARARQAGLDSALSRRNLLNGLTDDTVAACHSAVGSAAPEFCDRLYRTFVAFGAPKTLRWCHRHLSLVGTSRSFEWTEATGIVLDSFGKIGMGFRDAAKELLARRSVHVSSPQAGTQFGGFTLGARVGSPLGYRVLVSLAFNGAFRDIFHLAHELGHGAHSVLWLRRASALTPEPAPVMCETMALLAEKSTAKTLLARCDEKERASILFFELGLLFDQVVRPIAFSTFEMAMHKALESGPLDVEQLCNLWIQTLRSFYGDIINLAGTEYLWASYSHWFDPFYMYSYSVGQLLAGGLEILLCERPERSESLEKLLSLGGSKSISDLAQALGLAIHEQSFWKESLALTIGSRLKDYEQLIACSFGQKG